MRKRKNFELPLLCFAGHATFVGMKNHSRPYRLILPLNRDALAGRNFQLAIIPLSA
ncbi:MAG: hypothetical protein GTO45_37720 [Candidatus Aminicenantes bacterium]|nr:hypothetical protein [Candidatus Aminicenantes bacterium]NIN47608.1 hypothetical protein [Candidatus Aminicenantes bacterium]NIN90528.1 hypothetical protein [Candidatus Aminicenantes bacterium]NIO87168.1 hypothetical protein [Candidatus Aminicenantes bacterium]NIQ73003.1 hypothetical protein [Candidatus Aminicenantes bacterium]